MAGQSRAAQRREKSKKKQPTPATATSTSGSTGAKQQQQQQQKKPKQSAYDSGSDSDDEQFGDAALAGVIPLKSLEDSKVRDFVSELEQNALSSKKASKRTRAEIAQHEIDKKKKRYREDKAQKIVWRKFDRENRTFEQYYQELLQLPADEWDRFVASLKEPMPVHVRVNGNYKSLAEIVTGTMETDFDMSDRAVKLASGDEQKVEFAPVPWTENKMIWKLTGIPMSILQLTIDSKSFRKSEPLKDLSNYFRAQCHLGLLLRQEPSTSIIPAFLQVTPGDRVLDLCGGGEHRAPMIVEALSATESAIEQTGLLVVNERDASAASNAHRTLTRTLALSREVVVTAHKALEFPQPHDYDGRDTEKALFDRVICSAPCSGDGLIRKIPERWRTWNPSNAFKFHGSQIALAQKAMAMAKVGGTVVYCTRSFNPIENEAVVAELLRSGDDAYELVDVSSIYPELKRSSGCASWKVLDEDMENVASWDEASDDQKRSLRATMWPPTSLEGKKMHLDRCMRILPHQNDTHGLFVVVIKKCKQVAAPLAGPASLGPNSSTSSTTSSSKQDMKKKLKVGKKVHGSFSTIDERNLKAIRSFYGLAKQLNRPHFMERSGFAKDKSVHLVTPTVSTFLDDEFKGRLAVYKAGVEVLRRTTTGYDLFDEGARALLPFLSRRVIQLQMSEFASLLSTKEMWLKNASDVVRDELLEMQEGSLCVVLDDMEPAQTADQDIVLVATKRHSSYSLASTSSAIARVKMLISELNTGDGDDDGYDSFEYED